MINRVFSPGSTQAASLGQIDLHPSKSRVIVEKVVVPKRIPDKPQNIVSTSDNAGPGWSCGQFCMLHQVHIVASWDSDKMEIVPNLYTGTLLYSYVEIVCFFQLSFTLVLCFEC